MKTTPFRLEEIDRVAGELADEIEAISTPGAFVVGLTGDLGAGKTTLVQALARYMGVTAEIVSPTFVIMKIYNIEFGCYRRFIHIDAYRLESGDDLLKLRFAGYRDDPDNLIVIEWPELVASALPEDTLHLQLRITGEDSRELSSL